jgi:P4 family phage/plasmid primase-like protien
VIDMGPDPNGDVEPQPRAVAVQADIAELVAVNVLVGRYRYVAGLGWLEYLNGAWRDVPKNSKVVRDAVRDFMRQRVDDLRAEGRTAQASLWKAAMNVGHVNGILYFAEAMNGILTGHDELDRGPDLVNCRNGVLNLATGYLGKHQPSLKLTKQAGAAYDPDARSESWDILLEAIPEDVQPWLQLRFGQALSGYSEDSLVLLQGGGENGKSAFMSAIMRAFGTYAGMISPRILLASNTSQHPTELMDLMGLRLALLEETPEEGHLDVHQLKMIIGTPQITARRMRQDSISFPTTHSLFINSNPFPLVSATDHGTWRRLVAAKFPFKFVMPNNNHTLAEGERWGDPDLKARIQRDPDLPAAALAWVVQGALNWYADRAAMHVLPPPIADATTEWRADSDVGYQFAAEHLTTAPNHLVPVSYMAERFNTFLEAQGKRKWSTRVIASRLPQSVQAALGREATSDVVKIQSRHQLGITDPFDAARHILEPGKTIRAWVDLKFTDDVLATLPDPLDHVEPVHEATQQLQLEGT